MSPTRSTVSNRGGSVWSNSAALIVIGRSTGASRDGGSRLPSDHTRRMSCFIFKKGSEFDPQLKLEYTRQIGLRGGLAEVGIGNVRIDASETNIIEQVERISSEHKA